MQRIYKIFLGAIVVLNLTACTKENEEALKEKQGVIACDTTHITYSINITAILKSNCYSCHSSIELSGNINLEGYSNVKEQADNQNLLNVITYAPGYPPMPENAPKLSDCDINTIRAWINNRVPDN